MTNQIKAAAIHDISCTGRCSLTVALPILSAAGIETAVLPTAVLSAHTGFSGFTFRDLTNDIVPVSEHWQTLGLHFDALYSGFLGSVEQIDLIADVFDTFARNGTMIMVDPVMADNGKLYSVYSPDMAKKMAKLCKKADIIVPNLTEAAFLLEDDFYSGYDSGYDKSFIEKTLIRLSQLKDDRNKPKTVVLTSVSFEEDKIGAAAYNSGTGEFIYNFCDKADGYFHGTGDVFASALLSALLNGFPLGEANSIAVDFIHKCITYTQEQQRERLFGVCFEKALPHLIRRLNLI